MTIIAAVGCSKPDSGHGRYKSETVIPGVPSHSVFTGFRHMTLYTTVSVSAGLVVSMFRKADFKYCLWRIFSVAREAKRVVFAGFYSERGVSASV